MGFSLLLILLAIIGIYKKRRANCGLLVGNHRGIRMLQPEGVRKHQQTSRMRA